MTTIHICRPHEPRYQVRVRRIGHRKYEPIGKPYLDYQRAWKRLCKEIGNNRRRGAPYWTKYKRGDILMVSADPLNNYHGPSIIEEIVCH